jgi:hypothetical protein
MDRRDLTMIVCVAQNTKCHAIHMEEISGIAQLHKRRKRTMIICLTYMYSEIVKMLALHHGLTKSQKRINKAQNVDENI